MALSYRVIRSIVEGLEKIMGLWNTYLMRKLIFS